MGLSNLEPCTVFAKVQYDTINWVCSKKNKKLLRALASLNKHLRSAANYWIYITQVGTWRAANTTVEVMEEIQRQKWRETEQMSPWLY